MEDYLKDDTGDVLIKNGDFVKGNADKQDIEKVLLANVGDWKMAPTIGPGLRKQINGPETPQVLLRIKKRITSNLEQLSFRVNLLRIKTFSDIQVNAQRT